jgi:hypothetical protein
VFKRIYFYRQCASSVDRVATHLVSYVLSRVITHTH